jgi:predicted nucleic acid-binding protein
MRLFDTSAWIEFFEGTNKGEYVKSLFSGSFTSAITLAEICAWYEKNDKNPASAIAKIKKISMIIPVHEEALINAGFVYSQLRKQRKKIGLIDAIIYVTSQLHGLVLLTKDTDFRRLPGVELVV